MEELHLQLLEAGNQLRKLKYSELIQDLSFREFTLLAIAVKKKKKGKSMSNVSEMAGEIRCSIQSLSRTIRNLEKRGLVERVTAPDNRRNTIVVVTAQGEELVRKNHGIMENFMTRALSRMPEEEIMEYIRILNHLYELLKDEMEKTIKERADKED